MTDQTVASTILAQLGGNKFVAMTGASSFASGERELSMRLPRNKAKAKGLRIILDPTDTYTMIFLAMKQFEVITVSEHTQVYAEDLQRIFTEVTGLETHL